MTAGAFACSTLLGLAAFSACDRHAAGHAASPTHSDAVRWEGVLEPVPELIVVVRPQTLQHDKLYGSLVARAVEAAREHSQLAASAGVLEAMEDAEEVIVGAGGGLGGPDDLTVVVRGVRADIDPAELLDESGHTLWAAGADRPAASVRELVRARSAANLEAHSSGDDASLFELPGRTWVIATGAGRTRARDALAAPAREGSKASEAFAVPANASAMVRLSGPAIVARVRALRPPGLLAPLGRSLRTVTALLSNEDGAVRATLSYDDPSATPIAEATLRDALYAFLVAKPDEYAWLRSVRVGHTACCVELDARIPDLVAGGVIPDARTSPRATTK